MDSAKRIALIAAVSLLAAPSSAYAATNEVVIPAGLGYAAGVLGLITALFLLVDAVLLRRVAEGSMIAENILYMMLAVVCFAASMLARFAGMLEQFAEVADLSSFAADLLMTVGMALLTLYFFKVRTAMTQYVRSAAAYKASLDDDSGDAGV